jgi:penicillin-insensitive murein endopeptidase
MMRAGLLGLFLIGSAACAASFDKPAPGPVSSIGSAANGCIQGAQPLAETGPGWQILRPSHNRFWGNSTLIAILSEQAARHQSLGSLLIGDMSLPRGGRMPSGHASHQTGLDADVLFRLSDHPLTIEERDEPDFTGVVEGQSVDKTRFGEAQLTVLRDFAKDPRIERIFVNPVIKRHLCRSLTSDRDWLHVIRPWWGHNAHFHVRLACPAGNAACEVGPPIPAGDGCGTELDWWFTPEAAPAPAPKEPVVPKAPPPIPAACRPILGAK